MCIMYKYIVIYTQSESAIKNNFSNLVFVQYISEKVSKVLVSSYAQIEKKKKKCIYISSIYL